MQKKNSFFTQLEIAALCSMFIFQVGCSSYGSTKKNQTFDNDSSEAARHYYQRYVYKKQPVTDASVAEYINRIGKRIVIVSDFPEENFYFKYSSEPNPLFSTNSSGEITISKGLIHKLNDEAELASILSRGIIEAHKKRKNLPSSSEDKNDIDKNTMIFMSRAGYDPKASIELQEKYIKNQSGYQNNWVSEIFKDNSMNYQRLQHNKELAKKLPIGLQREKHRFENNVGL